MACGRPGRPNVYATADLGSSDDMLLLTGHLDTVGVAANWETNPPRGKIGTRPSLI